MEKNNMGDAYNYGVCGIYSGKYEGNVLIRLEKSTIFQYDSNYIHCIEGTIIYPSNLSSDINYKSFIIKKDMVQEFPDDKIALLWFKLNIL